MRLTKSERRIRRRHLKRIYRMEMRAAKQRNKVSGQFMKRVLLTTILAAFVFAIIMIIVFIRTGAEPSTLIENVFRFLSVEGGAMALIKSVKTVAKKSANEEPERQQEETEVSG